MILPLWFSLLIAVLPHPSDPQYECILVTRAPEMAVLCAPGGNVLPVERRMWTGSCNAGECP